MQLKSTMADINNKYVNKHVTNREARNS